MHVRLALRVAFAALLATLSGCGSAAVSTPIDSSVQPCQDDQDCQVGYACTGGYCQKVVLADAGSDVPQSPRMVVSPNLLDFGNAYVGGEFAKTFTIENVGGAPLTVSGLVLTEDHTSGAFTVQSKALPFIVDPAGSETVTVTLRPNDTNIATGSILVHSDDPDWTPGTATVQLLSHQKGSPDLGVCAHRTDSADCMESSPGNAILDYGTVDYGTSVERLVDLSNIGQTNVPINVTDIYLTNPAHFTLSLFQLVEDAGNPGTYIEQAVTLPFMLSAGDLTVTPPIPATRIRVHLVFTALGIDVSLPSESLMIKDASSTTPTSVPIIGTINGCIPHATDAGVPDGGSDPKTDPYNCGTCGNVCVVPHGTPGCVNGQCTIAACDSGWENCNGTVADGCEADLNGDPNTCGGCSNVCSFNNMMTRTCAGGVCNGTCATGFNDCNGNKLTDGCESNRDSDPDNCSGCGVGCSTNHMATRTCGAGVCNGQCSADYADCDGNKQSNGCEINIKTNTSNCGSCGYDCNAHLGTHAATGKCEGGSCKVDTCAGGYYDMDGNFGNGCECTGSDTVANACSTSLPAHNAPSTVSESLLPLGDTDWYKFVFATAGATCIRPKIVLTGDSIIKMDVYTNCGSTVTGCSGSETSTGVTTWEVTYTPCAHHDPQVDPEPDTPTPPYWQLPLEYYVKVYAVGSPTSCLAYTVTVTQ